MSAVRGMRRKIYSSQEGEGQWTDEYFLASHQSVRLNKIRFLIERGQRLRTSVELGEAIQAANENSITGVIRFSFVFRTLLYNGTYSRLPQEYLPFTLVHDCGKLGWTFIASSHLAIH